MKNILKYILISLTLTNFVHGQQTNTRNYILTRSFKQAGANVNDISKVTTQLQYLDGLGRPLQNVFVGQNPAGADIVQPIEHDNSGRQAKEFLTYVSSGNNGAFQSNAGSAIGTWYSGNPALLKAPDYGHPYKETFYEQTSLSRPTGSSAPGSNSTNTTIKYKVNTSSEVKRYDYKKATNTIEYIGDYPAGKLTRKQFTDEQGNEINEYTDYLGNLICKQEAGAGFTYYIYDIFGLLRGVLQPNFQDSGSFADHAFIYNYDDRSRQISRKIPGSGTTNIAYDIYDRPVFSQDANQLGRGVWMFFKYDALNRQIMTGEVASSKTRDDWQTFLNSDIVHHETPTTSGIGYTISPFGSTTITEDNLLNINYYDVYSFPKASNLQYNTSSGYSTALSNPKSLNTGSRSRMLLGNGQPGNWITTCIYYDSEYRPIQTIRQLFDLGTDAIEITSNQYKYDLAPVISLQKTEQILSGSVTNTHLATFNYDHADRLLSKKEKVTTGTKTKEVFTLAQRYNVLGQLQSKWYHSYQGTKYRYRTDYTNNIRGWLTDAKTVYKHIEGTNDLPFYTIGLAYANPNPLYSGKYSSGNISSMEWGNKNDASFTKGLSFTYDQANRLIGSTGLHSYTDTESDITYDKNGNIQKLKRGGSAIDDLEYIYTGSSNRLSSIKDNSSSNTGIKMGTWNFAYDGNGNMTTDGTKGSSGATISYNYLNLPKAVSLNSKNLTYDYDASGIKHKYLADSLTVKYAGSFEYNSSNAFVRVGTTEGQAVPSPSGDTLRFDYFIKDHLGNVRIVFNEKGEIIQNTDYYPFGLDIVRNGASNAASKAVNKYLFQEQEYQAYTGYSLFKWRLHDPLVGRFLSVDRLSEKYSFMTPYQIASNNPITNLEIDGLEGLFYTEKQDDGSERQVIEKNVIVLVKKPKQIPAKATEKQIAKIERQNSRLNQSNLEKVNAVRAELNDFYKNAQDGSGKQVEFKFNVSAKEVNDTDGGSNLDITNLATSDENVLKASENVAPYGNRVPAAVITTGSTKGSLGLSNGVFANTAPGAPYGTTAHEISHTLRLNDNSYLEGGILNSPPQNIISSEVDKIKKLSLKK